MYRLREHRGCHQGRVGDPHPVVDLVPLAEPAQDGDRVLDRWLVHDDRLEAPLQGGVLLDVLAVLVQGRGADGVQLAAGEHRLQQVGGVHRALRRAGADHGVQLVDEQDDLALGGGDLLEHRLQAFLELAAVLRAGHHGAQVEGHHPLVLQPLGHVAAHDALGQPLGNRRLADPRLADQDRVVLRSAAEDLDDAPDLLVSTDDRVELAVAGSIGQVPAVLGQGLVGRLRVFRRHALAPSDLGQGCEDFLLTDADGRQNPGGRAGWLGREDGEQQVLGGNVLVVHPLRQRMAVGQDAARVLGQGQLGAGDLGKLGQLLADPFGQGRRVVARPFQHGGNHAFGLLHERVQQVQRLQLGMAFPLGQLLRSLDGLGRLLREPLRAHQWGSRGRVLQGDGSQNHMCSVTNRSKVACNAAHLVRDPSSHSGVRVVGSSIRAFRPRSSTIVASLSLRHSASGASVCSNSARSMASHWVAKASVPISCNDGRSCHPFSDTPVGLNEVPVVDSHRPKDPISHQDQDGERSYCHALHDGEPLLRPADQNNDGTNRPRNDRSPAAKHVEHQGEQACEGRYHQKRQRRGTEVGDGHP